MSRKPKTPSLLSILSILTLALGPARTSAAVAPAQLALDLQSRLDAIAPLLPDAAARSDASAALSALQASIRDPAASPSQVSAGLTLLRALSQDDQLAGLEQYLRSAATPDHPILGQDLVAGLDRWAAILRKNPNARKSITDSIVPLESTLSDSGKFDRNKFESEAKALFEGTPDVPDPAVAAGKNGPPTGSPGGGPPPAIPGLQSSGKDTAHFPGIPSPVNTSEASAESGANKGTTAPDKETAAKWIDEILNISWHGQIPASVFAQHSINDIATSLIERLHQREIQATTANPGGQGTLPTPAQNTGPAPGKEMVDFMTDTQLHHLAWSSHFLPLIRGGLQNQFQTGTTNGGTDLAMRNSTDGRLLGASLSIDVKDKTFNALRPKYGIVFFPKFETSANRYWPRFGDFIMIFKDELKLRSTWTKGDSLSRVTEGKGLFESGRTFRTLVPRSEISSYFGDEPIEFQVWGDVGVEDVQAIGIFPDTPNAFRDEVIEAGFKVLQYETYTKGQNNLTSYRYVKTLSEGSPAALSKWIDLTKHPSIESLALTKRTSKSVDEIVQAMNDTLPSVKTPEDFLALLDPGIPSPSDAYKTALNQFANNHMDLFISLSPTQEQTTQFKKESWIYIDTIIALQEKLIPKIKSPSDFFELTRFSVSNPGQAYVQQNRFFRNRHIDTFLKLNPNFDDAVRFIHEGDDIEGPIAFREKYVPQIRNAGDFLNLFSPHVDNPSSAYLKALSDAFKRQWMSFIALSPSEDQLAQVWKDYPGLKSDLELELSMGNQPGGLALLDGKTPVTIKELSVSSGKIAVEGPDGITNVEPQRLTKTTTQSNGFKIGDRVHPKDDGKVIVKIEAIFADGHIQVQRPDQTSELLEAGDLKQLGSLEKLKLSLTH